MAVRREKTLAGQRLKPGTTNDGLSHVGPTASAYSSAQMMVGHVVGGLALFGGSVLAAAVAVTLAGMSGMRHLRKLVSGLSFPVVQQDGSRYTDVAEPGGSDYTNVVQLDRSEYTEVR